MRKLLFITGIVLLLPVIAAAQEHPKVEIGAGYSYLRGDLDANFNGWNFSIAGNPSNWFGVVGELGGVYFDEVKLHTFLVGPKFSYRGHERLNPYVQTLVGGAHLSNGDGLGGFAWTLGGGLDVKVNSNFAIRVFEATYLLTRFDDDFTLHNGRLSAGIVFRFGGD